MGDSEDGVEQVESTLVIYMRDSEEVVNISEHVEEQSRNISIFYMQEHSA